MPRRKSTPNRLHPKRHFKKLKTAISNSDESFIDSSDLNFFVYVERCPNKKLWKCLTQLKLILAKDVGTFCGIFKMFLSSDTLEAIMVRQQEANNSCESLSTKAKLKADFEIDYEMLSYLSESSFALLCHNSKQIECEENLIMDDSLQEIHEETEKNNCIYTIEVWLSASCVKESFDPYFVSTSNKAIQYVMYKLYGYSYLKNIIIEPGLDKVDVLLDLAKQEEKIDKYIQPKNLLPILKNYQKRCVQWMIRRETETLSAVCPFWVFNEELNAYYNYACGLFCENLNREKIIQPPGGILADEMGLGKTVEVLGCILSNKRPYIQDPIFFIENDYEITRINGFNVSNDTSQIIERACGEDSNFDTIECLRCHSIKHIECLNYEPSYELPYYCPHCWKSSVRISSRATLIVCPFSILHQWREEISKHVECSSIKVLLYNGVSAKYIQPYELADQDIVLTSYETLKKDLNFVDLPRNDRLRHPKRFNAPLTPLLGVDWWRICLDEAQMVECVTTKSAMMISKLHAVNRWCVTGTPIQKSVHDIYGLLLVINWKPWACKLWWNFLITECYKNEDLSNLIELLKQCFWRRSKEDVQDELNIKECSVEVEGISFSPVEQHFYMRQRERCSRLFWNRIAGYKDLNVTLKTLDTKTAGKMMAPLMKLQHACFHPQAVRGQFISFSKKALTMEELLERMIKSTTIESEEAQRKVLSGMNGQAGVYVLMGKEDEAVKTYRNALNWMETSGVRTDKLQKFHTLTNLAEILQGFGLFQKNIQEKESNDKICFQSSDISVDNKHQNDSNSEANKKEIHSDPLATIGHTLRDDNLLTEAESIKQEYLNKGLTKIEMARHDLNEISQKIVIEELLDSIWWMEGLNEATKRKEEELLLMKAKEATNFQNGVTYITGLKFSITNGLKELKRARNDLLTSVIDLKEPDEDELNRAIDCHLRITKNRHGKRMFPLIKCIYCKVHEKFNKYEGELFQFVDKQEAEEMSLMNTLRRGNWSDGKVEKNLKIILGFVSKWDKRLAQRGKKHLEIFDNLKKEFRALRAVWMNLFDFTSSLDELNMAALRLRLRLPDEEKKENISYVLDKGELQDRLNDLKSDEILGRNELKKCLARLNYLKNLVEVNSVRKGEMNHEECPICRAELGLEWGIFCCGHCLCLSCLDNLLSRNGTLIKCVVCREATKVSEIMFVDSKEEQGEPVLGSWSAKVEAIIKRLRKITKDEPDSKCIVFSAWSIFLVILGKALHENGLRYLGADGKTSSSKQIVAKIEEFKRGNTSILLLPIKSCSRGLNIIEANHVLLVEPGLNPANEYQAIGRVHRFGQTKPCTVHKFILQNTIEEKIHAMFKMSDFSLTRLKDNDEKRWITLKHIQDILE